jgi:hypothetical protein
VCGLCIQTWPTWLVKFNRADGNPRILRVLVRNARGCRGQDCHSKGKNRELRNRPCVALRFQLALHAVIEARSFHLAEPALTDR